MKKIFALCLSFVMLLSLSTTAFAAEPWDESAGGGETTITGHIYSRYEISIPATIALEYEYTQCPVTISQCNIENGYAVNVYCTNLENGAVRLELERANESIYCHITNADGYGLTGDNTLLASFQQSDITNGDSTTKYFTMSYDKMGLPGDYSGIMQYSFCCEPISE